MKVRWFVSVLAVSVLALAAPAAAQSGGDGPAGGDAARIHWIQGIPDTELDVRIDGETVISGFSFRDTQDLSGLAGQTLEDVELVDAGTGDVVLEAGDVTLPASGSVTVIAHLKVNGTPGLSLFDNDLSAVAAGESRLVIRHLAAAPPVDVVAAGETVFEGLANGQEVSADVPAGDVSATLVPSGEEGPVILGPADLPLLEGVSLIVYGLGSIERDTMTVITETIEGLGRVPTAIDTGNSPVGTGPIEVTAGPGLAALAAALVLFGVIVSRGMRRTWPEATVPGGRGLTAPPR